ncbi:PD-(D/E)XK nuclease family protein [Candidatus Pacearchaeota archaeon]|nr:PD-(D/E)XK nuclease family protein [Candidatus Pacearchaeota archaeon]
MDPKHLSYSKISTYIGCPFEYLLKYGLGIETRDNPYLAFGKLVHEMLDKFWDIDYKSPESFGGQFTGIWYKLVNNELESHKEIQFQYPEQKQYMLNRGRKMLERFYLANIQRKKEGNLPILREYRFSLKLAGKEILGVFDRIDEENKNGTSLRKIYDYKTDARPPKDIDEANFVESFQFTFYRIAHNILFQKDAIVHAHYLQTGRIFPIKYHERPEEFVIKQIDHVWNHIARNKFGQHISYRCKDNCQLKVRKK